MVFLRNIFTYITTLARYLKFLTLHILKNAALPDIDFLNNVMAESGI